MAHDSSKILWQDVGRGERQWSDMMLSFITRTEAYLSTIGCGGFITCYPKVIRDQNHACNEITLGYEIPHEM